MQRVMRISGFLKCLLLAAEKSVIIPCRPMTENYTMSQLIAITGYRDS